MDKTAIAIVRILIAAIELLVTVLLVVIVIYLFTASTVVIITVISNQMSTGFSIFSSFHYSHI